MSVADAIAPAENTLSEPERIVSLGDYDRDPEDEDENRDLIEHYTQKHKLPGGEWTLRPVQAVALDVLSKTGGLVGAIGVGHGKTLIGSLAPKELELDPLQTVYFTPAALRPSLLREQKKYRAHFDIEEHLHIESYTKLSQPHEGPRLLHELKPRLIILDEAHKLANADSARTKRFLRYMADYPDTHLIAMSGTLTNDSIKDYAHFLEFALGEDNMPIPGDWPWLESWARALDPSTGAQFAEGYDWDRLQRLNDEYGDGRKLREIYPVSERKSQAREAYLERLSTTPGVVQTSRTSVQAGLIVDPFHAQPEIPEDIRQALLDASEDWLLPGDEEIDDPLAFHRAKKQLCNGFYYRWDWDVEPYNGTPDREWLYARREIASQIRHVISHGPQRLDSPYMVRQAIQAGEFDDKPDLIEAWETWQEHKHKPVPPTVPVWLSDYLIDHAIGVARETNRGSIVWYSHRAVADKLEDKGVDVYWPGGDRNPENALSGGDGVIACSIESHRKGKNLQVEWSDNLILTPPSSGTAWEQLIGRTHRPGQTRDSVMVRVYSHAEPLQKSVIKARKNAQFTQETQGQRQKMLYADWTHIPGEEHV